MCIMCDAGGSPETALRLLSTFDESRRAMSDALGATAAMLALPLDASTRRRLDRAHKHMRRVMRDWNRTEQIRSTGMPRA